MRGLTAQHILEIWEWSGSAQPLNRALALLSAACPDTSWEQLAALSLGQRDARLLALREKTFGDQIQGRTECEHCGESLEFSITTRDIRASDEQPDSEYSLELDDYHIGFHLPTSMDLLAISQQGDPVQAGHELLQRCLIHANLAGEPVDPASLPDKLIEALAGQMSQCDPQAEVLLNLHCPACDQDGQVLFDINSFIWTEFVDLAKRLMQQVHLLARGYGWRESDILAMSAWRRRYYMELLGV